VRFSAAREKAAFGQPFCRLARCASLCRQAGLAQAGVEAEQGVHGAARVGGAAGFFYPGRGRVEVAQEKVGGGHAGLHPVQLGVEGAEAHGAREMLDGGLGVAVPQPQEGAEEPCGREIGLSTSVFSSRAMPPGRSPARWASA